MRNQIPSCRRLSARRGFTLIELMVTIGIIAVLGALLLPMIFRMQRSAQVTTMKLNLHSISLALEAYKTDYGDYPKNPWAYTDGATTGNMPATPPPPPWTSGTPRTDPTLAMALVGPGPAGYMMPDPSTPPGMTPTNYTFTNYANGDADGQDGVGFRNLSVIPAANVTANGGNVSVPIAITTGLMTPPTFVSFPRQVHVMVNALMTDELMQSVPIQAINLTTGTITLRYPLTGVDASLGIVTIGLMVPSGQPSSYLPIDKFKIYYPPVMAPAGSPGTPLLLDSWGQPILYFPVYDQPGEYTNSKGIVVSRCLFGSPTGNFYHLQPGQPGPVTTDPPLQSIFWSGPTVMPDATAGNDIAGFDPTNLPSNVPTSATYNQLLAVQWKLGDVSTPAGSPTLPDNVLDNGEVVNMPQQPYILMSAGPSNVFVDISGMIGGNFSPGVISQKIKDSGNVYNFDQ